MIQLTQCAAKISGAELPYKGLLAPNKLKESLVWPVNTVSPNGLVPWGGHVPGLGPCCHLSQNPDTDNARLWLKDLHSTQLERVKEFWETKQNKQKNLMYSEEKGEKEKGLGEKRIFLRLSVNLCKSL